MFYLKGVFSSVPVCYSSNQPFSRLWIKRGPRRDLNSGYFLECDFCSVFFPFSYFDAKNGDGEAETAVTGTFRMKLRSGGERKEKRGVDDRKRDKMQSERKGERERDRDIEEETQKSV